MSKRIDDTGFVRRTAHDARIIATALERINERRLSKEFKRIYSAATRIVKRWEMYGQVEVDK